MRNFRNQLVPTLGLMAVATIMFIFPALAFGQTAPPAPTDAPPDLTALISQALDVFSQWKVGGLVVGLVAVVNLLTNLTKLQWVKDRLSVKPWAYPLISCALAFLLAFLGALASHASVLSALAMGITAGLGAVGFHELINSFNSTKQAERAAGAALMDAVKVGDGVAHDKVAALTSQLDKIDALPPKEQDKALAAWATANPPASK